MAKALTLSANERTAPRWAGVFIDPRRLLPGGGRLDPTLFFAEDSVIVDVGAAGALAAAVAIPLDAPLTLGRPAGTVLIPAGTVLAFTGTSKTATVDVDVVEGAVSIHVLPLVEALVDADVARYPGRNPRQVSVPSGILVGRTYAERDLNGLFGPAADADDEKYLIAFTVGDVNQNQDVELVLPSTSFVVKENYLPVKLADMSAANRAWMRANFTCTIGWE